jgi:hypothetical protein
MNKTMRTCGVPIKSLLLLAVACLLVTARGVQAQTTCLQDTFTGTSGTAVTSHTMNTGPGWTLIDGTSPFLTGSNALAFNASDVEVVVSDCGHAGGTGTLTFSTPGAFSTSFFNALVLRHTNDNNRIDVRVQTNGGGTAYELAIVTIVSGASTTCASENSIATAGTPIVVTVVDGGSLITVTDNQSDTPLTCSSGLPAASTVWGILGLTSGFTEENVSAFEVTYTSGGSTGSNLTLLGVGE